MVNWFYNTMFTEAIYSKTAQAFEDFFCDVMKAADDNFNRVKSSGRIGDCSCDGYNLISGDYYLCYSPEDINKVAKNGSAVKKIKSDIAGIISKWDNIKTINYVINDKFIGLSPIVNKLFIELKKDKTLPAINIFSMEALRKTTLSLNLEDKQRLLGYAPDLSDGKISINFDVVSKIIKYIEEHYNTESSVENYIVPDFLEKIKYNNLSSEIADKLNYAKYYIQKVDDFFNESPSYNKSILKDHLKQIYLEACKLIKNDEYQYADRRFKYILDRMVYNPKIKTVVDNSLVIIATFFESCDIFEEPLQEKQ